MMQNLTPQNDNDKLLAAASYFVPALVGLYLYLSASRANPYLRYHAQQSIVFGVGLIVAYSIAFFLIFLLCIPPLAVLAVHLYYTYKGYTTPVFTIPVVTDLTKQLFKDFPTQ